LGFDEVKRKFGSLSILVGDGSTGIAVFTVGEAGTDPDMSAALVYGLEQAMREHSASAKDVFFGGLSPQGGLGWCVRQVDVGGESRELYVGVMLSPGEKYTYDVNILYQDEERGWLFRFLRESLLDKVVDAIKRRTREGRFDEFLSSGQKIGALKREGMLKRAEDLGETYSVLSEAYSEFQRKEEGATLDAIARDGGRADGRMVVAEAAREYLEAVFDAQDAGGDGGVLVAVRGFKRADEAFTHVWLSCAEACCETNPAFLFLAGGGKSYLDIWRKALNDVLKEWRNRAVKFLLEKKFGEDLVTGGGFMVSRDELMKVDGVLRRVASGLEGELRGRFPLVALAFEKAGRGVLEELAGYAYTLIQSAQEKAFSDFKSRMLEELGEERIRLLYYGLTIEEMKARVEDHVNEQMKEFEDRLYMVSHLLACPSPAMDKARRELKEEVWEKVVSVVMKGEVPVLLSSIKHVKDVVKDVRGKVFLEVAEAFLKEAGGSVMAALPALGYMLEEAGVLEAFIEKVKEAYGEVKASSEGEVTLEGLKEKKLLLLGCAEDVQRVGSAFMRGLRKSMASWMSRVILDEEGKPLLVKLLYDSYLDMGRKVNGARLAFMILEVIVSELRRERVSGVDELAGAAMRVYDPIMRELKKVKGDDKVKKGLEKFSKKTDVTFTSIRQLLSYLAKRRSQIWGWVLGEGEGEVMLIPPISLDPEDVARFYVRISDVILEEVSFVKELLSLLKSIRVDVEGEIKDAIDFLVSEARKLRGMRGVKRKIEELLAEERAGIFRRAEPFEEIVEKWIIDPFFGGREEFLEDYAGYALWEDRETIIRLVDRAVKRLAGSRDDSELVARAVEAAKRQKGVLESVMSALSEHFSLFTQYLESQSMRVELAFLSTSASKTLKRKPSYPDLKMELKAAEEEAANVEAKGGKPSIILGEITDDFFPRGEKDVEACLKGLGKFKAKRTNSGFLLEFELPGFGEEGTFKITKLARVYAWGTFLKENEEYFRAFRELLGLVSPNAQRELDMLKEFLRFNIFKIE